MKDFSFIDELSEEEFNELRREIISRDKYFDGLKAYKDMKARTEKRMNVICKKKINHYRFNNIWVAIAYIARLNLGIDLPSYGDKSMYIAKNPQEHALLEKEVDSFLDCFEKRFNETEELRKKQTDFSGSEEDID